VAVRLGATLDETEALRRGNSSSALLSSESAAPLQRPSRGGRRDGAARERLRFDLTREIGYSYPGAEDEGATGASPSSAVGAGSPLRGNPAPRRGRAAAGRGAGADPGAAPLGLLPAPPGHAGAGPRGGGRGARPESARRLLPPGRGRGSSVSSLVCYLTGLSHIDPVKNDLFLGRFLNEELTEVPTSTSTSRGTSARS